MRQAEEAATQQRFDEEIGLRREALGLWRGGHPLSNVPGANFRNETVALEQRHRRVAARLFDLEFMRGNYSGVLDELIRIGGYYPADRRLCEQFIYAQYRSGHVADAANGYERHKSAIEEETGENPTRCCGTALRDRAWRGGRGRGRLRGAGEASRNTCDEGIVLAARACAGPASSPSDLIGRDDLVAEVTRLLRANRIRDAGDRDLRAWRHREDGAGVAAANASRDRYPDGQLYLELRDGLGQAIDTSEVAAQFLRSLDAARIPETKAERLADLRSLLARRRVLIVLDDADGVQVAELAPANPGCAVVVTARQRLPEISDAHRVAPLEPLNRADATELFLRVVREAGVVIDDDQVSVDRVVTLCGGLPLALRIAGALRVHEHPVPTAELADRLARHGPQALVYGRQSVARTIGAGFERLDRTPGGCSSDLAYCR